MTTSKTRRGGGDGRRPTINDIARMANVSKKTVSRVINRSPSVKRETREKIDAIIAEHGYAPDPQARGLAFRRSFLIGMIYDNPTPQYVVNMQQGILDAIRGSGYELVVHPCDRYTPSFLEDARRFVERQKLFGVVLPPSVSEDDGLAELLHEIGCPYIRIASVPVDGPENMIVTEDRLGGVAAARHLLDLGHKRFAFVSGPPTFRSSHERKAGYVETLAQAGIEVPPPYLATGAYTFESGVACGEALLSLNPPPTAIFAANDEMAVGVLRAARMRGVATPEELSVVGYDDFQIASRVWPPLTTVHTPTREIGRIAAEKLFARVLEGQEAPAETDDILPSLVVRESTARPRD